MMIACPPPDFQPRTPQIVLPSLCCDCHAHILGPEETFPYSSARVYTPPDCLLSDYQRMLKAIGVQRAVLVQPSVYGTDNSAMLSALSEIKRAGKRPWRAVAVVDPEIAYSELEAMHTLGVRGVRVNVVDIKPEFKTPGQLPMRFLVPLAEKIAALGWHMEFLLHVDEFPNLDKQLTDFPVPVVFGHFGYSQAQHAGSMQGFATLTNLMRAGTVWVKLTGPYRIASADTDTHGTLRYAHVAELASVLLAANEERVVWGTDWPHVMHKGPIPNDADIADLLLQWIPDERQRNRVLVENPAKLYDF